MPLVPETKMVNAREKSASGTHWPGKPRGQCSKLRPPRQFCPAFLEPTPWQVFSINTLIFQHSLSFHIFTYRGQHTLSSVTFRENTITLSLQLTAVNRHKNVYAMQTFSYLLPLFGEIFSSFKNNRNFVKPSKTWEKIRSSWYTLLRFYRKYLVKTHRTRLVK